MMKSKDANVTVGRFKLSQGDGRPPASLSHGSGRVVGDLDRDRLDGCTIS